MKSQQKEFHEIQLTGDSLKNKIGLFAGKDGFVDKQSFFKTCTEKFHFTQEQAEEVTNETFRRAWRYGTKGVHRVFLQGILGKFTPQDAVPLFALTYDGGLYHQDGSFNEKLFVLLEKKYACEDDDGEKIISLHLMKKFLEKETHQPDRIAKAPWMYQQGTLKNQEELFNLFFSKLVTRYIKKEGYATLRNLKLWYVNSKAILDEIEAGKLPGKRL